MVRSECGVYTNWCAKKLVYEEDKKLQSAGRANNRHIAMVRAAPYQSDRDRGRFFSLPVRLCMNGGGSPIGFLLLCPCRHNVHTLMPYTVLERLRSKMEKRGGEEAPLRVGSATCLHVGRRSLTCVGPYTGRLYGMISVLGPQASRACSIA